MNSNMCTNNFQENSEFCIPPTKVYYTAFLFTSNVIVIDILLLWFQMITMNILIVTFVFGRAIKVLNNK